MKRTIAYTTSERANVAKVPRVDHELLGDQSCGGLRSSQHCSDQSDEASHADLPAQSLSDDTQLRGYPTDSLPLCTNLAEEESLCSGPASCCMPSSPTPSPKQHGLRESKSEEPTVATASSTCEFREPGTNKCATKKRVTFAIPGQPLDDSGDDHPVSGHVRKHHFLQPSALFGFLLVVIVRKAIDTSASVTCTLLYTGGEISWQSVHTNHIPTRRGLNSP
jgi:hypothetical protein